MTAAERRELREFRLVFRFDEAGYVLDTQKHTVKYYRCDEDEYVEIRMRLTDEELAGIRDEIVSMGFFDYPHSIHRCTESKCADDMVVNPSDEWSFDVSLGSEQKVVLLNDPEDGLQSPEEAPRRARLFELGRHILQLLQRRRAWRKRPPHGCGFM